MVKLNWLMLPQRHNMYDGSEEFWIVVKETGKREESRSVEEIHKKESKATYVLKLIPFCYFNPWILKQLIICVYLPCGWASGLGVCLSH